MRRRKNLSTLKRVLASGFVLAAAVVLLNVPPLSADQHYTPSDLSGRKVAVLAGEGLHDGETLFPIGFLVNRGAEVTVVGVTPGYVKAYNSDTWVLVEKSVDQVNVDDLPLRRSLVDAQS